MKHQINPDLQRERDNCSFDIAELTTIIDGSPEKTKERKEREECFLVSLSEGPSTAVPEEYLSHREKYERGLHSSCYIFKQIRKWQEEGKMNINNYRYVIGGILSSSLVRDGSVFGLHYIMFMPAIINLGSEEQHQTWLKRAWTCSIIGTFAQTELGHGTFIRGLETTATYDPETKEFVLNTPTLTSYKWWPGGLGHTSNHCIVVAQLHTGGKCHGIHSFIVQIRDEDTHMPLPGVKIGNIGAKLGLNAVDNGYLALDHVRIPRMNMLMRHAQVMEDGTYVKSRNSKLNYGAMMFVRVVIVFDMLNYLTKAVTIATRYSAVRRQCQVKEGEPEVQILDYMTQQHKLFIGISAAHALRISANRLWDTLNEVSDQIEQGNLERLPELHALACCLKAISTADTAALVERCRLACGGHGYMLSSNLPLTYGLVTAACTYEGENTVLLLQTARFLMKTWQHIDTAKTTPTIEYLKITSDPNYVNKWEKSVQGIIRGFQVVAMRKTSKSFEMMKTRMMSGLSQADAWNMTSVQLVAAAEAHCRAVMLQAYHEATVAEAAAASPQLGPVLLQLLELYAAYWALEKTSDLLQYTPITGDDITELQIWYEELLTKIRPNAVGLVDAFDIRDDILQSTLGAYDGRVYERLFEEAQKAPLNAEPVNQSFHQYLKPFMQGKL
ncbi:hypothetical protein JYU34_003635 [Plutella xylostella]|uniref:Acyl-coenzyme A oxidase n=1 Tax=Plutella xylostella TaxID=51655 RepID=A0ABQ7R0I4_PLUXY|nr:hypothetical protein JYU34_003635 [Plutella xylostella]